MWVRQGSPAAVPLPAGRTSSASESQPGGHKPAALSPQPGCWKLAQCRMSLVPGSRCPQPGAGREPRTRSRGPRLCETVPRCSATQVPTTAVMRLEG